MKLEKIRDAQLGRLIAEEIDFLLTTASDLRLSQLSVVDLETKKGGRAFVLCLGLREGAELCYTREDTATALERATGYLRAEVSSMLNLKRSPLLTFRLL